VSNLEVEAAESTKGGEEDSAENGEEEGLEAKVAESDKCGEEDSAENGEEDELEADSATSAAKSDSPPLEMSSLLSSSPLAASSAFSFLTRADSSFSPLYVPSPPASPAPPCEEDSTENGEEEGLEAEAAESPPPSRLAGVKKMKKVASKLNDRKSGTESAADGGAGTETAASGRDREDAALQKDTSKRETPLGARRPSVVLGTVQGSRSQTMKAKEKAYLSAASGRDLEDAAIQKGTSRTKTPTQRPRPRPSVVLGKVQGSRSQTMKAKEKAYLDLLSSSRSGGNEGNI